MKITMIKDAWTIPMRRDIFDKSYVINVIVALIDKLLNQIKLVICGLIHILIDTIPKFMFISLTREKVSKIKHLNP
tara:strand:- start:169 stop:396 length:228 start_codon:yes stop_codon:yes gene_type:complete